MSLGHGRHYLSIPGPSVMPDRVLQEGAVRPEALREPVPSEEREVLRPDLEKSHRAFGCNFEHQKT